MPHGISIVDPITGERESKITFSKTAPILILEEMTYDPKTGRIFGMHYDVDKFTTDLYEINSTTYALTKIASVKKPFFTLSADNGFLLCCNNRQRYKKVVLDKNR